MRKLLAVLLICLTFSEANAQLKLRDDVKIPTLENFRPLPAPDADFTTQITALVKDAQLDEMTPAAKNPDEEDEWSSICVVDLSDLSKPRVGVWKDDNFIYPASSYKLYVVGEAVRQVVEGELDFDQRITVKEHNVRTESRLAAGDTPTLSEVLRLTLAYSDNTAANLAIDAVDRQRASALLRAMGLQGHDITRKYLSRSLEDEGYAEVPGTTSNAYGFATFLYATETAAIGGGRGRGLIKSFMATDVTVPARMRAGLPDSATLYSKTGTWNIFTSQVGFVEDGSTRYIICVLTPYEEEVANPRIAKFTRGVHALLKGVKANAEQPQSAPAEPGS
jgi:beta-lactamase class A